VKVSVLPCDDPYRLQLRFTLAPVPDPFSEGSHAFEAGRGWYACPYEYNTHEWERWHAGYASALGRRP
jgi:hypothetical protein